MQYPIPAMNAVVTALTFLILCIQFLLDRTGPDEHRLSREAYMRVFLPILVSSGIWTIEYALTVVFIITFEIDVVINCSLSLGFLFAGWSLFRLKEPLTHSGNGRTHPSNAPWLLIRRIVGHSATFWLLAAAMIAIAVMGIAGYPIPRGRSSTAAAAILVLGLGLLDGLADEPRAFLGVFCGASVIAYAIAQLFGYGLFPSESIQQKYYMLIVLVLKTTLLFSIGSFWALATQRRRAERATEMRLAEDTRREQAIRDFIHHDILGTLSRVRYAIGNALQALEAERAPETAAAQMRLIDQDIGQAETALRKLLRGGPTSGPSAPGVRTLLDRLLPDMRHRCRISASLSDTLSPIPDPRIDAGLAAIAKEALNNACKHSGAANVSITLGRKNGLAVMIIADDGRGIEIVNPTEGHYGLKSMQQTALALGGFCTVKKRPGGGTEVYVELPLAGENDERDDDAPEED